VVLCVPEKIEKPNDSLVFGRNSQVILMRVLRQAYFLCLAITHGLLP
jgi:hypothetical protein